MSDPVTVRFSAPDLPGDQRSVAQYHACWTSPPLTDHLHILGRCRVSVDCRQEAEEGQLYAALCHVMTSRGGGFRLLTYGLLKMRGESTQRVTVEMDAIGYSLPPGDSLLLMLSPGSFPTAWPPSQPTSLTVLSGSLTLPLTSLHTPDLDTMFSRPDLQPRLGPEKDVEVVRGDSFTRELRAGLSDSVKSLTTYTDEGCKYFRDVDTLVEETARDVYTIDGDDPLSAVAYSYRNCVITYQARRGPEPIKTQTETESWMRCDDRYFVLENTLTTRLDDKLFWQKTWNDKVERK